MARPRPLSRPGFEAGIVLTVSLCFLWGTITKYLVVAKKTFSDITIKSPGAAQSSQTGPAGSLVALKPAGQLGTQTCYHPGDAFALGFHLRAPPATRVGASSCHVGRLGAVHLPPPAPQKNPIFLLATMNSFSQVISGISHLHP